MSLELEMEGLLPHNTADLFHEINKRSKKARKAKLKSPIYFNDPIAFIYDYIDWDRVRTRGGRGKLTTYQEEILANIPLKKRVSVRSPRGAGKTTIAALALLWFANTRDGDDWKVPTTAAVFRQLEKFLWPEIHRWARLLKWDKLGRDVPYDPKLELQRRTLQLSTGSAFAASADHPEHLEGAHAEHLFYIFDEAKAIKTNIWDSIEGSFAGLGEMFFLAISTPGPPAGRFYDIQTKAHIPDGPYSDWWTKHITLEELIANGIFDEKWVLQRKRQYGEENPVYKNHFLGEFSDGQDEVVIPVQFIEAAQERWKEWMVQVQEGEIQKYGYPITSIGVDIGRTGPDPNAYAIRNEYVIVEVLTDHKKDTMHPVKETQKMLKRRGGVAVIDVDGVGGGPFDRLRELGCNVMSYNGGASTNATDISGEHEFVNIRAASWWHMRELLDPLNGYDVCLPPDDIMKEELSAPKRKDKEGKIAIEPKKDIRERIGRSTDRADAVVQAFSIEILDKQWGDYEVYGGAITDNVSEELTKQSEIDYARLQQEAYEKAMNELIEYQGFYFPSDYR